jgi:hypothetical protein
MCLGYYEQCRTGNTMTNFPSTIFLNLGSGEFGTNKGNNRPVQSGDGRSGSGNNTRPFTFTDQPGGGGSGGRGGGDGGGTPGGDDENPGGGDGGGHGGSGGGSGGGGRGNPPPAPPAGNAPVPGDNNCKLTTPDPYDGKEDFDAYGIWKHEVTHFAEHYDMTDDAIIQMFSKFISRKARVQYLRHVTGNLGNRTPGDAFNGIVNHCFLADYRMKMREYVARTTIGS